MSNGVRRFVPNLGSREKETAEIMLLPVGPVYCEDTIFHFFANFPVYFFPPDCSYLPSLPEFSLFLFLLLCFFLPHFAKILMSTFLLSRLSTAVYLFTRSISAGIYLFTGSINVCVYLSMSVHYCYTYLSAK